MDDLTFTVRVDFSTHDALQRGITDLGFSSVQVLAPTDTAAALIAAQIVAATRGVPTRTTITDCIA